MRLQACVGVLVSSENQYYLVSCIIPLRSRVHTALPRPSLGLAYSPNQSAFQLLLNLPLETGTRLDCSWRSYSLFRYKEIQKRL